eukprot:TRINITY_DN4753_c0_g1_i1.p1 TRINITY_DN4753_c0_g1~~TRINITY_DN4753_c0_g1_i1.p1  ORF type:complete len:549 (+),score=98.71 TRINITY_DN4753_c0_g1_i1:117-1649(+)
MLAENEQAVVVVDGCKGVGKSCLLLLYAAVSRHYSLTCKAHANLRVLYIDNCDHLKLNTFFLRQALVQTFYRDSELFEQLISHYNGNGTDSAAMELCVSHSKKHGLSFVIVADQFNALVAASEPQQRLPAEYSFLTSETSKTVLGTTSNFEFRHTATSLHWGFFTVGPLHKDFATVVLKAHGVSPVDDIITCTNCVPADLDHFLRNKCTADSFPQIQESYERERTLELQNQHRYFCDQRKTKVKEIADVAFKMLIGGSYTSLNTDCVDRQLMVLHETHGAYSVSPLVPAAATALARVHNTDTSAQIEVASYVLYSSEFFAKEKGNALERFVLSSWRRDQRVKLACDVMHQERKSLRLDLQPVIARDFEGSGVPQFQPDFSTSQLFIPTITNYPDIDCVLMKKAYQGKHKGNKDDMLVEAYAIQFTVQPLNDHFHNCLFFANPATLPRGGVRAVYHRQNKNGKQLWEEYLSRKGYHAVVHLVWVADTPTAPVDPGTNSMFFVHWAALANSL